MEQEVDGQTEGDGFREESEEEEEENENNVDNNVVSVDGDGFEMY